MEMEPAPAESRPLTWLSAIKAHRVYSAAAGYLVGAWIVLQVAAIVLPGFGAPAWTLRALMIVLALGLGITTLLVWGRERRRRGLPIVPRAAVGRMIWIATAVLPVALVTGYSLLRPGVHPLNRNESGVGAGADRPGGELAPAGPVPEKSIAVLPFENLSDDKANGFFADGVQDEILTDLAKVADLKVIARSSVMQYKAEGRRDVSGIGRQLGVAHLLEGSVQRASGKVRVNAQLIDVRTGSHQWAEKYDGSLDDVFAIQSKIAQAIADQLQAKLSPVEKRAIAQWPTGNVSAFDLYSRARTIQLTVGTGSGSEMQLNQAIELLNQALARDPSFYQAACGLAAAHDRIYLLGDDHTVGRIKLAEAALDTAFRLAPNAGEPHLARAEHLYSAYLDYDGALKELDLARHLLPNAAQIPEITGYIQRRRGDWEGSIRSLRNALELDPRSFALLQQMALTAWFMGRFPEAESLLIRALDVQPGEVDSLAALGHLMLDWKADTRPLHDVIESIRTTRPAELPLVADRWLTVSLAERDRLSAEAALAVIAEGSFGDDEVHLSRQFGEGLVARMTGDTARARKCFLATRESQEAVVNAQPDFGPPWVVLGLIDAALGRNEEALREARRAVELLPLEKDSINGLDMIVYGAVAAAWAGDKDSALEALARVRNLPTNTSNMVSYGGLKLLPYWDPLRGDPRFEALVTSRAPKP